MYQDADTEPALPCLRKGVVNTLVSRALDVHSSVKLIRAFPGSSLHARSLVSLPLETIPSTMPEHSHVLTPVTTKLHTIRIERDTLQAFGNR